MLLTPDVIQLYSAIKQDVVLSHCAPEDDVKTSMIKLMPETIVRNVLIAQVC